MHQAAYDWVSQSFEAWRQAWHHGERHDFRILEIGSLNINGTARDILQPFSCFYHGIDVQNGPGVDELIDARVFVDPSRFDIVVCCEVFEHTPHWREILDTAAQNLADGGLFIGTMAGETREPHSGMLIKHQPGEDCKPFEWEHYANIGEWELSQQLKRLFKTSATSYINPMNHADLRCWAWK